MILWTGNGASETVAAMFTLQNLNAKKKPNFFSKQITLCTGHNLALTVFCLDNLCVPL